MAFGYDAMLQNSQLRLLWFLAVGGRFINLQQLIYAVVLSSTWSATSGQCSETVYGDVFVSQAATWHDARFDFAMKFKINADNKYLFYEHINDKMWWLALKFDKLTALKLQREMLITSSSIWVSLQISHGFLVTWVTQRQSKDNLLILMFYYLTKYLEKFL